MPISPPPSAPQHDLREELIELLTLRAKVAQLERAVAHGGVEPVRKFKTQADRQITRNGDMCLKAVN